MQSAYPEIKTNDISVATGSKAGGKRLILPLSAKGFILEHIITLLVTQAFSVVPSTFDPFRMIDRIGIDTGNESTSFMVDGLSFFELEAFYEKAATAREVLGANSTAAIYLEIHHEMVNTLLSLGTGIDAEDVNKCNLIIDFAADDANCFIGGTHSSTADIDVEVEARQMDGVAGIGHLQTVVNPSTGDEVANAFNGAGMARRAPSDHELIGRGSGRRTIPLQTENHTRSINFITYKLVAGVWVRSDDVVERVEFNDGTENVKSATYHSLQAQNEVERGQSRVGTGLASIDFGDDNRRFRDLHGKSDMGVDVVVKHTGDWKIVMLQDAVLDQDLILG